MRCLLAFAVATVLMTAAPSPHIAPQPPGELAGYIAIGTSPDFIQQWLHTPAEQVPKLPLARQFAQGETAYIALIVTGQQRDNTGKSDVTVDVRISRPDGSVLFTQDAYGTSKRPVADRPGFVMVDPALDLAFDSTDPPGKYSVVAIFHDAVASKGAIVEICIELVPRKA